MTAAIIQTDGRSIVLDLSQGATLFGQQISECSVGNLSGLINRAMTEAGTGFSFGRYAEPRGLYSSDQFGNDTGERRTIHMGVDVFCVAGTPIYSPLAAIVEHVANNDNELDYGPMIVLRHQDESGADYFSLYGHLDLEVLRQLRPRQTISAGEKIATVGSPPINGNWPPHLHFQQINDLLNLGVDFPGVATPSEREYWLSLSPSPAAYFPEVDAAQLEYA